MALLAPSLERGVSALPYRVSVRDAGAPMPGPQALRLLRPGSREAALAQDERPREEQR
jgi:hypothetical protein